MRRSLVAAVVPAALTALVLCGCTSRAANPSRTASPARSAPVTATEPRAAAPSRTPAAAPASDRGTVVMRSVPVPRSAFAARPTLIYVPAIARRDPSLRLPVIELLHGEPGGPADWVDKGGIVSVLDAFAAAHDGRAPVVVLPDINGAYRADTECVSSGTADVEGYLTTEVPDYLIRNFPVTTDRRQWAVAGNSEGGSCAVMLGLRHPGAYFGFGDMSGLAHLTVGNHEDAARTITALFGGSRTQYLLHDPLWLSRHRPDKRVSAWLRTGTDDTETRHDQAELAAAQRAAGLAVDTGTIAGGHGWAVWHDAFVQFLVWFWHHAQ